MYQCSTNITVYVSLEHPLHIFGLDYFLVCAKAMGLHYFSNLVPDSNLSRRGGGGGGGLERLPT